MPGPSGLNDALNQISGYFLANFYNTTIRGSASYTSFLFKFQFLSSWVDDDHSDENEANYELIGGARRLLSC